MSVTALEAVQELEKISRWTPQAVGQVLGAILERDEDQSDEHTVVYRSSGILSGLWRSVELRVPPSGGLRGMIILEPSGPIPMDEVVTRFGKDHLFSPPNPRAPAEEPTAYFEYKRGQGVLRLGFPDFDHPDAGLLVLDRMSR